MNGIISNTRFRFKFEDERVTKEDTKRALEEQYGGEEEVIFCKHLLGWSFIFFIVIVYLGEFSFSDVIMPFFFWFIHLFFFCPQLPHTNPGFNNSPFKFTKYSNAYMLVYIRERDKDKVICNVDEKDIAEHLRVRCLVY